MRGKAFACEGEEAMTSQGRESQSADPPAGPSTRRAGGKRQLPPSGLKDKGLSWESQEGSILGWERWSVP